MALTSLLDQVVAEHDDRWDSDARKDVEVTGERFGCGARAERERRACSFYLWLLGPTTKQLATSCPCR